MITPPSPGFKLKRRNVGSDIRDHYRHGDLYRPQAFSQLSARQRLLSSQGVKLRLSAVFSCLVPYLDQTQLEVWTLPSRESSKAFISIADSDLSCLGNCYIKRHRFTFCFTLRLQLSAFRVFNYTTSSQEEVISGANDMTDTYLLQPVSLA